MTVSQNCHDKPLVSVVMCSFNMEKHVGYAIKSVLNQTYPNFELIIVDDGSTDDTVEEIKKFSDSRVRFFEQRNQGPSCAFNFGVSKANGDFVAFFSGDDVCYPTRLEVSLSQCIGRTIVFSKVDLIDDDGHQAGKFGYAEGLFPKLDLSPEEVLFRFVTIGNYVNASSAFVSKKLLDEFKFLGNDGPFDPRLIQLQDFDLWVRMVKQGCLVTIVETPFIQYRIRSSPDSHNLSKPSEASNSRTNFERSFILRNLANQLDEAIFKVGFKSLLRNPDFQGELRKKIEVALLLSSTGDGVFRLAGLELLYELFVSHDVRQLLFEEYSFGFSDLMRIEGETRLFLPQRKTNYQFCSLYYRKSGEAYSEKRVIRKQIDLNDPELSVQFDLGFALDTIAVRFDLYEGHFDKVVKLTKSEVFFGAESEEYPTEKLISNGVLSGKKSFSFEDNSDPQIEFVFDKSPTRISIQGELFPC